MVDGQAAWKEEQWSFCEDHLVSFDAGFGEEAETHVRYGPGEHGPG